MLYPPSVRLKPTKQAKRVAFDGPSRTVVDGPFAEMRELVVGYWICEVKDMDEVVAWVRHCPSSMPGPSETDIRPLYEMSDFVEIMTPEAEALHDGNAVAPDAAWPSAGRRFPGVPRFPGVAAIASPVTMRLRRVARTAR